MDAGTVLLIGLKGLIGGSVVVLFAVAGEVLRPRVVAGITSGAPSVAIASLTVTAIATGAAAAADQALGMIAGAVAFVFSCLWALEALKRFGAARGWVLGAAAWLAGATALWGVTLR